MRTVNADLTSAQQSATATPYLEITCTSRDRATTRTYKTTDTPNRVISVRQAEGRFNGHLAVEGSQFPVAMVIQLQDSDKTLNTLDYKGYRVDVGWGFRTVSGDRISEGPPSFVFEQESLSLEGALVVELRCISMWGLLRQAWAKQTTTTRIEFAKDVEVRHILMELLGGRTMDAAILDDGGVFADHTADAKDPTDGADLGTADDVDMLPATPAVNDAFYFGDTDHFETVSIDLTTAGVGTWTLTFEYWDGSAWSTLTVTDNTSGFTTGKLKTITFTKPTDWATTTVNSQGPFYYVRARVSAFTSVTTQPTATKIVLHHDFSVSMDSSTAGQGDDDKPEYSSDFRQDAAETVQDVLANSLLVVRAEKDGFHFFHADASLTPIDYTYDNDGDHPFLSGTLRDAIVIPNKITFVNRFPGVTTGTGYSGSDTNTASADAIGTVEEIIAAPDLVTSDAVATTLAERTIKRLRRDRAQGFVIAPMSTNQEVWDIVRVADSRSGQTYDGRVSQVMRVYTDNIYQITLSLGDSPIRMVVPDSRRSFKDEPSIGIAPVEELPELPDLLTEITLLPPILPELPPPLFLVFFLDS